MPLQIMTDGGQTSSKKKKPSLMDAIKSLVSVTPTKVGVSVVPTSQVQPVTRTNNPSISNFNLGAKIVPTSQVTHVVKPSMSTPTTKPATFGEFQSMQSKSTPTGGSNVGKFMLPENSTVPTTWVPVSSAGVPSTPTLRNGSRGEEVRAIQNMLGIPADGIFGPQTQAAVLAFQKANGLSADGIVGPNTWSALLGGGKVPSGLSGGASTGGSGARPATPVSTPTSTSQPAKTPTVPSISRPEWTFNYQQPQAPDLQSLIAAAAQQLAPQYDILRRQMGDANKEALQGIENDMIRRGRFLSTYAGNRQDQQNQKYQQALSDLGVQEQAQATELGRQDYDKAIDRQQQDYARAYQEAMDAYARSWDVYTDQYRRDQDAFNNALKEREMALMEKQASAPKYTSSGGSYSSGYSSGGSSGKLTTADKNFINETKQAVDASLSRMASAKVPYPNQLHILSEELENILNGAYGTMSEAAKQEAIAYVQQAMAIVKSQYQAAKNR